MKTKQPTEPKTCPCGICGDTTTFTGTQRCNDCWEMEHRIARRPHIGAKLLAIALEDRRQAEIARAKEELEGRRS